jgi:hypothetical protein
LFVGVARRLRIGGRGCQCRTRSGRRVLRRAEYQCRSHKPLVRRFLQSAIYERWTGDPIEASDCSDRRGRKRNPRPIAARHRAADRRAVQRLQRPSAADQPPARTPSTSSGSMIRLPGWARNRNTARAAHLERRAYSFIFWPSQMTNWINRCPPPNRERQRVQGEVPGYPGSDPQQRIGARRRDETGCSRGGPRAAPSRCGRSRAITRVLARIRCRSARD